jgi:dTDP-4-amino-4,6-dideoxygalactose transaminase
MNAVMVDPIRCPVVWPYRLSEELLESYLGEARRILTTSRFRRLDCESWSERAAGLIHETMRLPAEWSVLPVRSGTEALMLALRAMDVRAGDEVAVPDLAFGAVAMTVLRAGARPVWLDVDEHTWNLAETTLVKSLDRRPKALIGVDNFGAPCDWRGIGAYCRENGIRFILDSCESLGAAHPDGPPSAHADLVVTSFSFTKPIHAAGTGGALCGPTAVIDDIKRRPEFAAWPTRLPELNAAFLVHAWPDLMKSVTHLNEIYQRYAASLDHLNAVPQRLLPDATPAWIIAPFKLSTDRWGLGQLPPVDDLIGQLRRQGIDGRRAFPPQSSRFGLGPSQPTSARLHEEILCLPTGAAMPIEWVDVVVEHLAKAKAARGGF